jgi:hypothetical protein
MGTYYSIRDGVILKHTREVGASGLREDTEVPQETLTVLCPACGWTSKALRSKQLVDQRCICGGLLQVTAAQ